MPFWRDRFFWIPLYVALASFVVWKFGTAKGAFFILAVIVAASLADVTSSRLIKENVERLRPCNEPEIKEQVNLLIHCGGGYSFTSSHAANHFAVAVFLCFTLGRLYRRIRLPLLLWAASIAYGQVYVGVHYPLDVICGALLGRLSDGAYPGLTDGMEAHRLGLIHSLKRYRFYF
jgi:membrane-associated phospholipid phosphatase